MAGSKKNKQKAARKDVEEEDVGTGDLPVQDEEAESRAASRKQKKQKKKPVEEDVEDDDEASQHDEDDNGTAEYNAKKKLRGQREHKKIAGYRSKAAECGFVPKAGVIGAMGTDIFMSALTPADAKRLMRFVPEVLNKSSYDKTECAARMKLSQESVPSSAARETQARCEAVMRKLMNEAVLRTVEKGTGTARVDAATMQSVLRPYQYGMQFSSVLPPKGLVRHAQASGALSTTTADEELLDQEKADNRELAAAAKKMDQAEVARKAAFLAKRNAKA